MSITVDIQYASNCNEMPSIKKLTSWAKICEESVLKNTELTIRIVDIEEISELNKTWRGIDKPTNVLSFPAGKNFVTPELIGDIVICAPVVMKEAKEQQKQIEAHWAHMVIHGLLHLLGYDHDDDNDAKEMESLEIAKLQLLNYPNPYQ